MFTVELSHLHSSLIRSHKLHKCINMHTMFELLGKRIRMHIAQKWPHAIFCRYRDQKRICYLQVMLILFLNFFYSVPHSSPPFNCHKTSPAGTSSLSLITDQKYQTQPKMQCDKQTVPALWILGFRRVGSHPVKKDKTSMLVICTY